MIESIRMKNFRKHEDLILNFDESFNLLHGRNNAGKSSIFYAIEYCLFGGVQGFKKISQLAKFKEKDLGVELVFHGINNQKYKLQRVHTLKGKSKRATGNFTLKKIDMDQQESYIISSDFGDTESDLSLKIKEVSNVSKRFFETAIHFYQGKVAEILEGSKKLDIVFGISAASTLANTFKRKALDFEKEINLIHTLKSNLSQSEKEKEGYKNQQEEKSNKLDELSNQLNTMKSELESFDELNEVFEGISDSIEKYKAICSNIKELAVKKETLYQEQKEIEEKNGKEEEISERRKELNNVLKKLNDNLKSILKQHETLLEKQKQLEIEKIQQKTTQTQIRELTDDLNKILGKEKTPEKIENKLNELKSQLERTKCKIVKLEKEEEEFQSFFKEIEYEKGDLEGILSRREGLDEKLKCEYCGAPIEPKKIEKEIRKLKVKLEQINKEKQNKENQRKEIRQMHIELGEEEKDLNTKILEVDNSLKSAKHLIDKIDQLNSEGKVRDKIEKIELELKVTGDKLIELKEEEKKNREKIKNLESDLQFLNNIIDRFRDLGLKLSKIEKEEIKLSKKLKSEKSQFFMAFKDFNSSVDRIIKKANDSKFNEKITKLLDDLLTLKEKNFQINKLLKVNNSIKELIISKTSAISTNVTHYLSQIDDVRKEINSINQKVIELDKSLAKLNKEIEILMKKEKLALNYRRYQEIFNSVQNIIRGKVSQVLGERILDIHHLLSVDDEFREILIDNDDYSLSVIPRDINTDESFPAMVFQGGGHKLILGLSYKIALGRLIGMPSFILVDEPTEFMDGQNRINLLTKLNEIAKETQILLVTHQDVDKIKCKKKIEIIK